MDVELQKKLDEVIARLKALAVDDIDYQQMDPIARMMLVALLHESQKIEDAVSGATGKLLEHFCENFIPRSKVSAMPAIALVSPAFKKNKNTEVVEITSGIPFVNKAGATKTTIEYLPLLKSTILPYENVYLLTHKKLVCGDKVFEVSMDRKNEIWIGLNSKAEIETLENTCFYFNGITGVIPKTVSIENVNSSDLEFCTMDRIEELDFLEPFDAQQATEKFMPIINYWKEYLQDMPSGSLLYISDKLRDRDVFKKRPYPRVFENWLESEALSIFEENTVWIRFEYPKEYSIPDNMSVVPNTLPIVNVLVNNVTLTLTSPIAKLQKQNDAFFIQVLETSNSSHKQGFNMNAEEIVVRDFDASCYHNGDLYRDVRILYNRFVEDYYAFIEYNGLKDGEDIKRLKELINRIGKSVGLQSPKYQFDSGTYVMKNINQFPQSSSTKVSYISTQGKLGNTLHVTAQDDKVQKLECKRCPMLESSVPVIVGAWGGKDKASADSRYEQIRYYSLTQDRLYTKMDVDAFIRKELIELYGKNEFRRIFIRINVEGAAGEKGLRRGIYIDIDFKDKKNYEKSLTECLKEKLYRKIQNKSCLSMPVVITLNHLD